MGFAMNVDILERRCDTGCIINSHLQLCVSQQFVSVIMEKGRETAYETTKQIISIITSFECPACWHVTPY